MTGKIIERKQQIRHAAQQLFRNKGYKASSMRSLAGELGMEAASLYHHISSKETILHEICFELANDFFAAFQTLDPAWTAEKKLKTAIHHHLAVIGRNEDAFLVYTHEWKYLSEPGLSELKKLRKKYESLFEKIIAEGMEKKEFRRSSPKLAARILLTSVNAGLDRNKSEKMNREAFAQELTDLFFSGIKSNQRASHA